MRGRHLSFLSLYRMEKARGTVPSGDTRAFSSRRCAATRNPSARLETRRLPIDHRDRETTNVSSRCEEISFSEEEGSWRFGRRMDNFLAVNSNN